VLFCAVVVNSTAFAQAPIIVDLAVSALRGLAMGAGERAGQEIYDNMRGTSSSAGPTFPPPQVTPGTVPYERSPQTIPVEPPTPPDGLRWRMRNLHGGNITMQFYSVTRRGFHWPAGNQAYLITNEPVTVRLRCVPGEKICYGGWAPGINWGTGYRLSHPCIHCCRLCGSEESGVSFR
jgi:hypothetical protein